MSDKDMGVRVESAQPSTSCREALPDKLLRGLRVFCARNDITGTRFLMASNYHWTERLFWTLMLVLTLIWSISVTLSYLDCYDETAVTVMSDDFPRDKPVIFPTVGLCADATWENPPNLRAHLRPGDEEFHQFLLMLLYQDLYEPAAVQRFYNYTLGLPAREADYYNYFNFTNLAVANLEDCPSFFSECSFFGRTFNCCANFWAEPSMVGGCFLFDRIEGRMQFLNMTTFREMQHLKVKVLKPTKVFVMAQKSMPALISPRQHIRISSPGADANVDFILNPRVNDNDIAKLPIEVLRCYTGNNDYGNQDEPRNSRYISWTGCVRSCIMHWQLKVCDCLSWNFKQEPGLNGAFCTLRGYVCLERNRLIYFRQLDRDLLRSCQCLLMCAPQAVTITNYVKRDAQVRTPLRTITISMSAFPRTMFRRQLMRSNTDIVVSLGGIIALFFGVNLIHLCNFVYTMLYSLFYHL